MTTNDIEQVEETTEETNGYTDGYVAKKKDRSLNELLNLDSYDDLNDNEVKTLLEWEKNKAHWDEETTILRAQVQTMTEELTEKITNTYENAQSVLQLVLDNTPSFESVTLQSVTDKSSNE